MKNGTYILWFFLAIGLAFAGSAEAVQISVPSAPGAGYGLVSSTTGAYLSVVGPMVNLGAFNPAGDGSTDDSARFASAIALAASLHENVFVPYPQTSYAIASTITLGNGDTTAASTVNNVALIGAGGGGQYGPRIKWIGSANGTMIQINGQSWGIGLQNLYLDGNGLATTTIHNTHDAYGVFHNLYSTNWRGTAIINDTQCPSAYANGNGNGWNNWSQIYTVAPNIAFATASGISFDGCIASNDDTTQNVISNGLIGYGTSSSAYGIKLGFADNNSFNDFDTIDSSNLGPQILFVKQASKPSFPYANNFINWGTNASGIGGTSGTGGNSFSSLNTQAGGAFPSMQYISGTDQFGNTYSHDDLVASTSVGAFRFDTAGTERLTILNNGKIGIGTTSPAALLDVHSTAVAAQTSPTAFIGASDTDGAGAGLLEIESVSSSNPTGVFARVKNSYNACMFAENFGLQMGPGACANAAQKNYIFLKAVNGAHNEIGFNTTSPGSLFSFQSPGDNTSDLFDIASTTSYFHITSAGNVGIATTTPLARLDVFGNMSVDNLAGAYQMSGSNLLYASSTNQSTVIGIGAGTTLYSTSTQMQDVAIGFNALNASQQANSVNTFHAQDNVAIGYQAMLTATSTSRVTAIGANALKSLNDAETPTAGSGSLLTAIGYNALANDTIGYWDTAVGASALSANTTGIQNMALGSAALSSNTTGSQNVAMGHQAVGGNVSGNANDGVGQQALRNTTGSNNNGFGEFSGFYNTSGARNTFIGEQAGIGAIGVLNDSNSVIDTNMTFIGYRAAKDPAGLASTSVMTNSTAIGANAHVGKSNALVLGGTGANAVSVGIGTTTPWALLTLGNSSAPQIAFSDNSGGNNWFMRWIDNTFYMGTSTALATSTGSSALTIDTTKAASLLLGSTTCRTALVNGNLCLGSNGGDYGTASTTVYASKLQYDYYNSAGTEVCEYTVGTSKVITTGSCTQ